FIQAMSFLTSAMTSGPMPSPGRRRSLKVAMSPRGAVRVSRGLLAHVPEKWNPVFRKRHALTKKVLGIRHGKTGLSPRPVRHYNPSDDRRDHPRLRLGLLLRSRVGPDADRPARPAAARRRGDQHSVVDAAVHGDCAVHA